jgi:hypothetical protein
MVHRIGNRARAPKNLQYFTNTVNPNGYKNLIAHGKQNSLDVRSCSGAHQEVGLAAESSQATTQVVKIIAFHLDAIL